MRVVLVLVQTSLTVLQAPPGTDTRCLWIHVLEGESFPESRRIDPTLGPTTSRPAVQLCLFADMYESTLGSGLCCVSSRVLCCACRHQRGFPRAYTTNARFERQGASCQTWAQQKQQQQKGMMQSPIPEAPRVRHRCPWTGRGGLFLSPRLKHVKHE